MRPSLSFRIVVTQPCTNRGFSSSTETLNSCRLHLRANHLYALMRHYGEKQAPFRLRITLSRLVNNVGVRHRFSAAHRHGTERMYPTSGVGRSGGQLLLVIAPSPTAPALRRGCRPTAQRHARPAVDGGMLRLVLFRRARMLRQCGQITAVLDTSSMSVAFGSTAAMTN